MNWYVATDFICATPHGVPLPTGEGEGQDEEFLSMLIYKRNSLGAT